MKRNGKKAIQKNRVRKEPDLYRMLSYNGDYFPEKYLTYLRYTESWADTTAGGITYYIYRGNSIYDPYAGAGGDQVYGHDEVSAIYGRYKVLDSTITVEALNRGTEPLSLFVLPRYLFNPAPSFSTVDAAPRCKRALLNNGAGNSVVLESHATSAEFFDNPNTKDTSANFGANPLEPWHWIIYAKNVGLSALDLHLRVTIRYHTLLSIKNVVDDA